MNNNISRLSTKTLIDELITREGIDRIIVLPYEKYQIIANAEQIKNTGPVIILVIND